jgi:two-component system KDP operon response regulator KdpE
LPALARHGFTTTERPHDRDTERLIAQFDPDLVVLAIDPRQDDDLALVRGVSRACHAAVMVLAPGPHTNGLSLALEAGADVCLRDTDGDDGPSLITVRDLELEFDRCQAVREGETIPLTPTEFKILAFLARNAGKVVSPVEILRAVQDYTYSDREAQEIVKVYIRRIRRKVEVEPAEPSYIINVRGFGYMLERRGGRRDQVRVTEAA